MDHVDDMKSELSAIYNAIINIDDTFRIYEKQLSRLKIDVRMCRNIVDAIKSSTVGLSNLINVDEYDSDISSDDYSDKYDSE